MGADQRIVRFYARKDVQHAIASMALQREVTAKFGEEVYGKRPDTLQYGSDVYQLAQEGATSFHLSEEHWQDPLKLKTGMARKQLDELRVGWDLLLDIDCSFIEFSKITAKLLLEALAFYNIHDVGIKFSGNRGFHLIVPFVSFPEVVNARKTALLFPEGPRMIAEYLSSMIKDSLAEQITAISTTKEIREATGIPESKIIVNNAFNPFAVVDIDTILISSRHLFRSPYSLNEKSGLVSIVIKPQQLKNFKPSQGRMENVDTVAPFLPNPEKEHQANQLLVQAFDHARKHESLILQQQEQEKQGGREKFAIKEKIQEDLFPPCMKLLLQGVTQDGRKRAVFILIAFLKQMNYSIDEIEKFLIAWNDKNYEPLRIGYLRSQLSWHRRNQQALLPPNCANDGYYVPMGICKPDNLCQKIKNPANYTLLRFRMQNEQKPHRRSRKTR